MTFHRRTVELQQQQQAQHYNQHNNGGGAHSSRQYNSGVNSAAGSRMSSVASFAPMPSSQQQQPQMGQMQQFYNGNSTAYGHTVNNGSSSRQILGPSNASNYDASSVASMMDRGAKVLEVMQRSAQHSVVPMHNMHANNNSVNGYGPPPRSANGSGHYQQQQQQQCYYQPSTRNSSYVNCTTNAVNSCPPTPQHYHNNTTVPTYTNNTNKDRSVSLGIIDENGFVMPHPTQTRAMQAEYVEQQQALLADGASPVFSTRCGGGGGGVPSDHAAAQYNNNSHHRQYADEEEADFASSAPPPHQPSSGRNTAVYSGGGSGRVSDHRGTVRAYYREDDGADHAHLVDHNQHHPHHVKREPTPFRFRNTEETREEEADLRSTRLTEMGSAFEHNTNNGQQQQQQQSRGVATTVLRQEQTQWMSQKQQQQQQQLRTVSPSMMAAGSQMHHYSRRVSPTAATAASRGGVMIKPTDSPGRGKRRDHEAKAQLRELNAIAKHLSESPQPNMATMGNIPHSGAPCAAKDEHNKAGQRTNSAPKINSVSVGVVGDNNRRMSSSNTMAVAAMQTAATATSASRSPQPKRPANPHVMANAPSTLVVVAHAGGTAAADPNRSAHRPGATEDGTANAKATNNGRRATSEQFVNGPPNPQYFAHVHRQRQIEEEERARKAAAALEAMRRKEEDERRARIGGRFAKPGDAECDGDDVNDVSPLPKMVAGAVLATEEAIAANNKTRYEDLRWMLPYTSHPPSPAATATNAVECVNPMAPNPKRESLVEMDMPMPTKAHHNHPNHEDDMSTVAVAPTFAASNTVNRPHSDRAMVFAQPPPMPAPSRTEKNEEGVEVEGPVARKSFVFTVNASSPISGTAASGRAILDSSPILSATDASGNTFGLPPRSYATAINHTTAALSTSTAKLIGATVDAAAGGAFPIIMGGVVGHGVTADEQLHENANNDTATGAAADLSFVLTASTPAAADRTAVYGADDVDAEHHAMMATGDFISPIVATCTTQRVDADHDDGEGIHSDAADDDGNNAAAAASPIERERRLDDASDEMTPAPAAVRTMGRNASPQPVCPEEEESDDATAVMMGNADQQQHVDDDAARSTACLREYGSVSFALDSPTNTDNGGSFNDGSTAVNSKQVSMEAPRSAASAAREAVFARLAMGKESQRRAVSHADLPLSRQVSTTTSAAAKAAVSPRSASPAAVSKSAASGRAISAAISASPSPQPALSAANSTKSQHHKSGAPQRPSPTTSVVARRNNASPSVTAAVKASPSAGAASNPSCSVSPAPMRPLNDDEEGCDNASVAALRSAAPPQPDAAPIADDSASPTHETLMAYANHRGDEDGLVAPMATAASVGTPNSSSNATSMLDAVGTRLSGVTERLTQLLAKSSSASSQSIFSPSAVFSPSAAAGDATQMVTRNAKTENSNHGNKTVSAEMDAMVASAAPHQRPTEAPSTVISSSMMMMGQQQTMMAPFPIQNPSTVSRGLQFGGDSSVYFPTPAIIGGDDVDPTSSSPNNAAATSALLAAAGPIGAGGGGMTPVVAPRSSAVVALSNTAQRLSGALAATRTMLAEVVAVSAHQQQQEEGGSTSATAGRLLAEAGDVSVSPVANDNNISALETVATVEVVDPVAEAEEEYRQVRESQKLHHQLHLSSNRTSDGSAKTAFTANGISAAAANASSNASVAAETPSRRHNNNSSAQMQEHIAAIMSSINREQGRLSALANADGDGSAADADVPPPPPADPEADDAIWQERSASPAHGKKEQEQNHVNGANVNANNASFNESSYFHHIQTQQAMADEANTSTLWGDIPPGHHGDEDDDGFNSLAAFDSVEEVINNNGRPSGAMQQQASNSDQTGTAAGTHAFGSGTSDDSSFLPPPSAMRHTESPSSVMRRNVNMAPAHTVATTAAVAPAIVPRGSAIAQQLTYSPTTVTVGGGGGDADCEGNDDDDDDEDINTPSSVSSAVTATAQSFNLAVSTSTAALDTILSTLTNIESEMMANRGGGGGGAGGLITSSRPSLIVASATISATMEMMDGATAAEAGATFKQDGLAMTDDSFNDLLQRADAADDNDIEATTNTTTAATADNEAHRATLAPGEASLFVDPTAASAALPSLLAPAASNNKAKKASSTAAVQYDMNGRRIVAGPPSSSSNVQQSRNSSVASVRSSATVTGALPRINSVRVGGATSATNTTGSRVVTATSKAVLRSAPNSRRGSPAPAPVITAASGRSTRLTAAALGSMAPPPMSNVPSYSRPPSIASSRASVTGGRIRPSTASIFGDNTPSASSVRSAQQQPHAISRRGSTTVAFGSTLVKSAAVGATTSVLDGLDLATLGAEYSNNATNTAGANGRSVSRRSASVASSVGGGGSQRRMGSVSSVMSTSRMSSLMAPTASSMLKAKGGAVTTVSSGMVRSAAAPRTSAAPSNTVAGKKVAAVNGSKKIASRSPVPRTPAASAPASRAGSAVRRCDDNEPSRQVSPAAVAPNCAAAAVVHQAATAYDDASTTTTTRAATVDARASGRPSAFDRPQLVVAAVVAAVPPPPRDAEDAAGGQSPAPLQPAAPTLFGQKRAADRSGDDDDDYDRQEDAQRGGRRVSAAQSRADDMINHDADAIYGCVDPPSSSSLSMHAAMLEGAAEETTTAVVVEKVAVTAQRIPSRLSAAVDIVVPSQSLPADSAPASPAQLCPRASAKLDAMMMAAVHTSSSAVATAATVVNTNDAITTLKAPSIARDRRASSVSPSKTGNHSQHSNNSGARPTFSRNSFELPNYARATASSVARVTGVKRPNREDEANDSKSTPLRGSPQQQQHARRTSAMSTSPARHTTAMMSSLTSPNRYMSPNSNSRTAASGGGPLAASQLSPSQYLKACQKRMAHEPSFAIRQNALKEHFAKAKDGIVASLSAHHQQSHHHHHNHHHAAAADGGSAAKKLLPFNLVLRTIRRHMMQQQQQHVKGSDGSFAVSSSQLSPASVSSNNGAAAMSFDRLHTMAEDLHALLVVAEAKRPFCADVRQRMSQMADKENGAAAMMMMPSNSNNSAASASVPTRERPSMLEHLFPAEIFSSVASTATASALPNAAAARRSVSPSKSAYDSLRYYTVDAAGVASTVEECGTMIAYEELVERIISSVHQI